MSNDYFWELKQARRRYLDYYKLLRYYVHCDERGLSCTLLRSLWRRL